MTKGELRKIYKQKRQRLTETQIDDKSLAIANQALTPDIWDKSIYSLFLPIKKHKEVNTAFLLNILQGKDKNISISKSDFATHQMKHYLLTDDTRIKINKFGIPEPVGGIAIQPQQIDVVFMPLLAYDTKGNRIGYGGGFYDRFLSRCKRETLKIGLSFFPPEAEFSFIDPQDIPLDLCITPEKIYKFNP